MGGRCVQQLGDLLRRYLRTIDGSFSIRICLDVFLCVVPFDDVIEQSYLISLMGECTTVTFDVQYLSIEDKSLQHALSYPIREKWRDIGAQELFNGFQLVLLKIFTSLTVREQGK